MTIEDDDVGATMTEHEPGAQLMMQLGARARQRWTAATEYRLEQAFDDEGGDGTESELLAGVQARLEAAAEGDRPARGRWGPVVAIVLAASLVLVVWWTATPDAVPSLPRYHERMFETGLHQVRGDAPSEDVPVVDGQASVTWRFGPQTETTLAVALRIHAVGPQVRCLAVTEGQRIMPSGAIELHGTVDQVLGLGPGQWSLTVLVGPPTWPAKAEDPCARSEQGQWLPGVRAVASRRLVVIPAVD
ncbi:MAG: hypothetical protein AAGF11_32165 [Myxococcota bacterium]